MNRRVLMTAFFIIVITMPLLLVGEIPTAKPESVGMSSEKLAKVTEVMKTFVAEKKVAGVTTIVVRKGKVVFFESVGKREIEADTPMKPDSIFRIYSMSKPITSVAVMMLVEEGKIALDDQVAKYLPELKGVEVFVEVKEGQLITQPTKREMTVRDLLRHTSGLTYGFFSDTEVDKRYRNANILNPLGTLAGMPKKLGKLPLLYQPGTRFQYSVSSDLLGALVEVASGQKFDEFLQTRIFEPLDLRDTAFHVSKEKLDRFSANYSPSEDGGLQVNDVPSKSLYRFKPRLLSGGGGLTSTARDYSRLCQMLLNKGELEGKRLLKAKTVESMTKNQLPDQAYPIDLGGKRPGVGFGLGFSVVKEKTAFTAIQPIGEFGWGGAASTHFWISPQDELAVVVLTQIMPFTFQMEFAIKPLVYNAIHKN